MDKIQWPRYDRINGSGPCRPLVYYLGKGRFFMPQSRQVLAFDFGASSGRAMLGSFDGNTISIREIHRFSNDPETIGPGYYWDIVRLYQEIKAGLAKAREAGEFQSLGIDTWGVDYGLIDGKGNLMGLPRHYRDGRNEDAARQAASVIPVEELYRRTGIQNAVFNTIYQLQADKESQPYLLEHACRLLLLPDLFGYLLTGEACTEYSHASTTGLLDVNTRDWDYELIDRLGYPRRLFGTVRPSGTPLGALRPELCQELTLPPVQVISVAGHDTASAVAAVPSSEPDTVYISCGTWCLFGTELVAPNTSPEAMACSFTNEGGYGGKIRFLKNIMGLWLIQQSRRHWNRTGAGYTYDQLEQLARECPPFQSLIDVDDPVFFPPGDIPVRVQEFCRKTGQPVPETVGQIMRCLYDSIALKYRWSLDTLRSLTGRAYTAIHMVGGGIKDELLSQLAADVCGVKVIAGPVEATVIGNIAVQLIAAGAIPDIRAAREIIGRSFEVKTFRPSSDPVYQAAYQQYQRLLKR